MAKITYIEIAGKKCPLSFSLGAAKEIINKFGSIEKMNEALVQGDGMSIEAMETIASILEILASQGCAYLNIFKKDLPKEEGVMYEAPTREEIELGLGIADITEAAEAIANCFYKSNEKEIEAEANTKNTKAPEAE